jgi:hypothetical protein
MKFSVSILEYLGKVDNAILVLLSIIYNEKYYEATFLYNKEDILLTASEELEQDLGYKIIEDSDYIELLRNIIRKIVPYSELINRIEDFKAQS